MRSSQLGLQTLLRTRTLKGNCVRFFDSAFGNWWRYETKPNGGIGRQTKSVYLFIGMKTTGVHVKREHEIQTLVDRLSSGLHKCLRLCFGTWKAKAWHVTTVISEMTKRIGQVSPVLCSRGLWPTNIIKKFAPWTRVIHKTLAQVNGLRSKGNQLTTTNSTCSLEVREIPPTKSLWLSPQLVVSLGQHSSTLSLYPWHVNGFLRVAASVGVRLLQSGKWLHYRFAVRKRASRRYRSKVMLKTFQLSRRSCEDNAHYLIKDHGQGIDIWFLRVRWCANRVTINVALCFPACAFFWWV